MPQQPEKLLYEYAVVRYIPVVERGEQVNVGLVMMCKRRRWLRARAKIVPGRIKALFPDADIELLTRQLDAFGRIASGDNSPIGLLEAHERFRWLTAVRSACICTSRPHPGLCDDLDATFDRIFAEMVL